MKKKIIVTNINARQSKINKNSKLICNNKTIALEGLKLERLCLRTKYGRPNLKETMHFKNRVYSWKKSS